MSLQETERAAAAVAVAPRVTLESIEAAIIERVDFRGVDPLEYSSGKVGTFRVGVQAIESLSVLSICILVLRNGYTVIGKSAPASVENFNADLGKQFAYEDAVRQCWPLFGFALRDQLTHVDQGEPMSATRESD
jgi:hypothetical protein